MGRNLSLLEEQELLPKDAENKRDDIFLTFPGLFHQSLCSLSIKIFKVRDVKMHLWAVGVVPVYWYTVIPVYWYTHSVCLNAQLSMMVCLLCLENLKMSWGCDMIQTRCSAAIWKVFSLHWGWKSVKLVTLSCGLTLSGCQAHTKNYYHSPLQMDKGEKIWPRVHELNRDRERSLTKFSHGQKRLEFGIVTEFIINKIRAG